MERVSVCSVQRAACGRLSVASACSSDCRFRAHLVRDVSWPRRRVFLQSLFSLCLLVLRRAQQPGASPSSSRVGASVLRARCPPSQTPPGPVPLTLCARGTALPSPCGSDSQPRQPLLSAASGLVATVGHWVERRAVQHKLHVQPGALIRSAVPISTQPVTLPEGPDRNEDSQASPQDGPRQACGDSHVLPL